MTYDEQIEILQAAKEGKEIEYYHITHNLWMTKNLEGSPNFDFRSGKYRIKKQVKKLYLYVVQDSLGRLLQMSEYYANDEEVRNKFPNFKIIKRLDYTELCLMDD